MTANHLVSNLQIRLSQDQKELLMNISKEVDDVKLKKIIVHGIAIHHAGMLLDGRHKIEELFRKGLIPVLVQTNKIFPCTVSLIYNISGDYFNVGFGSKLARSFSHNQMYEAVYGWRIQGL